MRVLAIAAFVTAYVVTVVITFWLDPLERAAVEFGSTGPARLSRSSAYVLPMVGETERPPLKFQGNARSVLEVIDPDEIETSCLIGGPGALACTKLYPDRPTIVMPNPCAFPFDSYAVMLCHEVGHVNGWEHGRGA